MNQCIFMIKQVQATPATAATKLSCVTNDNAHDLKTKDLICSACEKAISIAFRKTVSASEKDTETSNEYWGNMLHIRVEIAHSRMPKTTLTVRTPTHVSIRSTALASRVVLNFSLDKNGKPDFDKPNHYEAPNLSTNWRSQLDELYVTATGNNGIFDADKNVELLRHQQSAINILHNAAEPGSSPRWQRQHGTSMKKGQIGSWKKDD